MKYLFVGDVHNKFYIFKDINRLDEEYNFDKIIFLGDYVDDWYTTNIESIETIEQVIELKTKFSDKYTFLLGNHELSYLGYPCSGHKYNYESKLTKLLTDNIHLFKVYEIANCNERKYYCSHAGITNQFAEIELEGIDNLDKSIEVMNANIFDNLKFLSKCSALRGGKHKYSSSMWADRKEHLNSLQFNEAVVPYQIIGHSPVTTVCNAVSNKYEYFFIDTHSTYSYGLNIGDKSYLMWNEDKFEVVY